MAECTHPVIDTITETEEYYSNGMFGVPASNLPLAIDIVNEYQQCTTCKMRFPIFNSTNEGE